MTAPDVPASSLVRRVGKLSPEAARLRDIEIVPPDPKARCQICGQGHGLPLVVLSPVIDDSNGQRITIALCRPCALRTAEVADHTVAPRGRRKRNTP